MTERKRNTATFHGPPRHTDEVFFLPAEGETPLDVKVQQDLEQLGHLKEATRQVVVAQAIEKYRQKKYLQKKYGKA